MSNSTFPFLFISPTLYILVPNILALRVIQRETPQKLGTSWDAWVEPLASASETSPSSLGWNPQLLIQSSPNSTIKNSNFTVKIMRTLTFRKVGFFHHRADYIFFGRRYICIHNRTISKYTVGIQISKGSITPIACFGQPHGFRIPV